MSAVTASVPSFILSSSSYSQVRCPTALLASSSSSSSSSLSSSISSSCLHLCCLQSLPLEPGVTILIVGVVQYKEEAELFKFRKLIVLAACAVLATGVLLFIIKVFVVDVIIVDIIIDCEIGNFKRFWTYVNVCSSAPASAKLEIPTWKTKKGGGSTKAIFKTKLLWWFYHHLRIMITVRLT